MTTRPYNHKEKVAKDLKVTIAHVRQAVLWAQAAVKEGQAGSLGGKDIEYNQDSWSHNPDHDPSRNSLKYEPTDCGTTCCIWGAAFLLANKELTYMAPDIRWWDRAGVYSDLDDLFHTVNTLDDKFFNKLLSLTEPKS